MQPISNSSSSLLRIHMPPLKWQPWAWEPLFPSCNRQRLPINHLGTLFLMLQIPTMALQEDIMRTAFPLYWIWRNLNKGKVRAIARRYHSLQCLMGMEGTTVQSSWGIIFTHLLPSKNAFRRIRRQQSNLVSNRQRMSLWSRTSSSWRRSQDHARLWCC